MSGELPLIKVTEIGEYIRHQSCDRRFKLEFNSREEIRQLPFYNRLFNALDPVLQQAGRDKENEWETLLKDNNLRNIAERVRNSAISQSANENGISQQSEPHSISWDDFTTCLQDLEPGQSAYGRQICIEGIIGAFHVRGIVDFILVLWEGDRPKIKLVECKASRKDRTYHRIQVTLYRMLINNLIEGSNISIGGRSIGPEDMECIVARIDQTTNTIQNILSLEPLVDLDQEEGDINRLLEQDGKLFNIIRSNLSNLDYRLDAKCDSCVFNIHCLSESARGRRLELLSIEPSIIHILREEGIFNIDLLANLDPNGPEAVRIRSRVSFSENLEILIEKARARLSTLPGGEEDPDLFEVRPLPFSGHGQLPEYITNGNQLIRVYLSVDYDYVENRIGALAAHVTKGEWLIHTGFIEENGRVRPNPEVQEIKQRGLDPNGRHVYDYRPLDRSSEPIVSIASSEWTGIYEQDTGAERQLIQSFLYRLIEVIAEIAEADQAPIHFYVWSRSEITHLVEACSRADSRLLGHLNELLGCRQGREQLIYSCLQDEVNHRFALGWTGRGLSVATSLRWFGQRYHWHRHIGGEEVDLDSIFTQDIFDFKTDLSFEVPSSSRSNDLPGVASMIEWAENPNAGDVTWHKFEIRSRFYDSLPAPYWRAIWGTLPDPNDIDDNRVSRAIRSYNRAAMPGYLRAYLTARTQALRWIEERIHFKNREIDKPLMTIPNLRNFTLGIDSIRQASIDFLRLEHHVHMTDWIAEHIIPPAYRLVAGSTIPIRDIVPIDQERVQATISLAGYDISVEALESICSLGENSFVRVTPCSEDPFESQRIGDLLGRGSTCKIMNIDWENRSIILKVLRMHPGDYRLGSIYLNDNLTHATIDESPSDFVAGRVESTLIANSQSPMYQWFDPINPQLPAQSPQSEAIINRSRSLLASLILSNERNLDPDQINACIDGLGTRVHLIHGPPGTGKTITTAIATLMRVLAHDIPPGRIVLVAASTHTALDNLLHRIDSTIPEFNRKAAAIGWQLPRIELAKAMSQDDSHPGGNVNRVRLDRLHVDDFRDILSNSVYIIGGTTNAILKLAEWFRERSRVRGRLHGRINISMLVIDEASMMLFPHFLALATLVMPNGEIMLSGDPRQLAPIVMHDWENEDRPPIVIYQPFVSSYEAVHRLSSRLPERAIHRSALSFTFRLPAEVRELIKHIYELDGITLQGRTIAHHEAPLHDVTSIWEHVWVQSNGLYLILHNETRSKLSNKIEAYIIRHLLEASGDQPNGSIAIVTPHRGQRVLLRRELDGLWGNGRPIDVIDTVERLQGGEDPVIIVSVTESEPSAININAEFILDLKRSNVALSRPLERLIVVCSEALLDCIPAEIKHYESTILWKQLRQDCTRELASALIPIDDINYNIRILTCLPQNFID